MTPRTIELALAFGALWLAASIGVVALVLGLRAFIRWWRERAVHIRLFPTLDEAEQDAIQRGDTRAIGHFRRLKKEQLHAALERAVK